MTDRRMMQTMESGGGGRILVVDDEHSIRYTFSLFLDESGYDPVAVADPEEALRILASGPVDLAFVDILLENTSGIELLTEIKRSYPATEVVIVTGAPSIETAAEALRQGAFDYLVKPVGQEDLLRITYVALRHKAVREEADRYRMNLEAIFRSIEDGIITVDRNLVTVEVNRAAERLCGFRREAALGRRLDGDLLDCSGECREALARAVRGGPPVVIHSLACRARTRPDQVVSVVATPFLRNGRRRDEGSSGGVLVVRDQTRLQGLERSLRRARPAGLVGESSAIRRIRATIESLKELPAAVLITGEAGAGKGVAAAALQAAGHPSPLVRVDCEAMPEEILERELFGTVLGEAPRDRRYRPGRFELADGGTLLLDEVGATSLRIQFRLAEFLERGEIELPGSAEPLRPDVRMVATTRHDLEDLVARGLFREDLYGRLREIELAMPALRERREDVAPLIHHLLRRIGDESGKRVTGVSEPVLDLFLRHSWPGNVRELEQVLEHAFVLVEGETIGLEHLPKGFEGGTTPEAVVAAPGGRGAV